MKIFKKNVFGADIDIEFDILNSILKALQKIYEFKLWMAWRKDIYLKSKLSFGFIKYALKNLPNGSFVIFKFDRNGDKFVQFMKNGDKIFLDIPMWITNEFYNRKEDLTKLLTTHGIKNSSITNIKEGKGKTGISISFENHYVKATEVAVLICKEIYGINEPCVFKYDTGCLVPLHSKDENW